MQGLTFLDYSRTCLSDFWRIARSAVDSNALIEPLIPNYSSGIVMKGISARESAVRRSGALFDFDSE